MRVISVTPAGRRRYLAALVPHLLRQRHVINEHHWWLNTPDEADARYVRQITAQHPEFFKICHKPVDPRLNMGESIWRFFRHYAEGGTLYVRFDDDIVYMADDAVANLVRHRLRHREPLLVVGNIVNNAVCAHFQQQAGLIPPSWGRVQNECLDRNAWRRGPFPRKLHELFLNELRHGREDRWKRIAMPIDGRRRFSINVISWLGEDFTQLPELASDHIDEEPFLTQTLPTRLNRPNIACGTALFAHFAYYTQRPYLEWTWPELIGHYQRIAELEPARARRGEGAIVLARHAAWRMSRPVGRLGEQFLKRWRGKQAA